MNEAEWNVVREGCREIYEAPDRIELENKYSQPGYEVFWLCYETYRDWRDQQLRQPAAA